MVEAAADALPSSAGEATTRPVGKLSLALTLACAVVGLVTSASASSPPLLPPPPQALSSRGNASASTGRAKEGKDDDMHGLRKTERPI